MERVKKREVTGYFIALLFDIMEYLILFHNDIPPAYPVLPIQFQRDITFNVLNGGSWTGLFNTLISFPLWSIYLFFKVPYTLVSTLGNFFGFSVLFLGTFFSVRYFLKKYFDAKGFLSFAVPIAVSIPVPFTWYTVSGVIYFFPGIFALILALLDYSLDVKNKINIREAVRRSSIAALAVTLGFTEARGIFFTLLTFFAFSLYFLIIYRSKIYIINWIKIFFLGVILFILLNINTLIYTEIIKPFIPLVGVSTVYNQLGIALQHVSPYYTLLGIMYWLGPSYYLNLYHADIILETLGTALSLSALLIKKKPVIIFLSLFILATVTYNFLGSQTIGYYLAQTSYVGYIVYLYPTYIPSYLFVAPFYILLGFAVFYITKAVNKGFLKYVKSLTILILLISPIITFYSPIALSFQNNHSNPVPTYVKEALNIISLNDSGIVLGFGNSNILGYFSSLPSFLSPDFYGYMNFIWNFNSKNWAMTLAYLGVQYLVYYNESVPNQVTHNQYFKLIYNNSKLLVFKNTLYKPYIISKGIYVAFNFPCILNNISSLNQTYPIVPFYNVDNLTEILPYVKGFIGYNVNPQYLIPMIAKKPIIISANNIYYNQWYSQGWIHQSPFWTPDVLNAIYNGGNKEPLNVTVHNGIYYVYVLPVFVTISNPLVNYGEITFSSANKTEVYVSGSAYNVSWVNAGIIKIENNNLKIYAKGINIVEVVLVPSSEYENDYLEALSLLQYRDVISFVNNSVVINNSSFEPKGYGLDLFMNPWIVYFSYAHYVKVNGNSILSTSYYFGIANVYITTNKPQILQNHITDFPFIFINFIIDIIIILYIANIFPGNFNIKNLLKKIR